MAVIGFDGGTPVRRFPDAAAWDRPVPQPEWRVSRTAAGLRISLSWFGADKALMALLDSDLAPGATGLPASCGFTLGGGTKIILETAELSGEEGDTATLRAEYRERNDRETDEDVAAGLQSRRVGMAWVERQETIEHYVARVKTAESGVFNGALFALWLQEGDPAAKAAYKVTRGDGDLVALGNTSEEGEWKGSKSTLGAAQRFAMGVQYASRHMLQVVVEETWRVPPAVDARCNVVLPYGIPENHRPLGTLAHFSGRFTWMRVSDGAVPVEGNLHRRTVVYLGVPEDMKPADPPVLWGDGPVDELLYKRQEGE